ncbi:TipAS antibiotic-recognition domain-containing protein [Lachnospiraceae bacterium 46-61]
MYGGKDTFLNASNHPISKEIAKSYKMQEETILKKLISKRNCDINSFEVKELIGEYAFVMKQICQIKQEKGVMTALVQYYRNQKIVPMIDEKYGIGSSEYFAQAIESFYK